MFLRIVPAFVTNIYTIAPKATNSEAQLGRSPNPGITAEAKNL